MWELLIIHPYLWAFVIILSTIIITGIIFPQQFWLLAVVGTFMFVYLAASKMIPEAYALIVFLIVAITIGFKSMDLFLPGGS